MKIGKYGNRCMKDEEVLLFIDTCIENGSNTEEAILDFKMIDVLFEMRKMYFSNNHLVNKTSRGYYRKGSEMANFLDKALEARLNKQL